MFVVQYIVFYQGPNSVPGFLELSGDALSKMPLKSLVIK